MKEDRQRTVLRLVATRPVHSQDELVSLLQDAGYEVTQATVSRDIKDLGLAKVPIRENGSEIFKYVIPPAAVSYVSRLHRAVTELVKSIDASANLIVLRTPPGSAMLVASAVDEASWPEVLGTMGGDDTVLVVVRSTDDTPVVKQRFIDLRAGSVEEATP